ncbi:hypothetical protein Plhal710r2_c050g0156461 [Plasmopara halstedii]
MLFKPVVCRAQRSWRMVILYDQVTVIHVPDAPLAQLKVAMYYLITRLYLLDPD